MGSLWHCKKNYPEKDNRENVKNESTIKINIAKNTIKKVDNNFYDISFKINKLKDIAHEGWEIELKDSVDIQNDFLKIGIIGEFKKGKTYILQKLLNMKFDNDKIIETKGLGIKYHKNLKDKNINNNYIILDTEGIENPLLDSEKSDLLINNNIKEVNEIEDLITEKLLKELFLQQFIIKYSEIPILVVNEINFSEQKLLSKIQNILKNNKKPKKLFVIHNLKNYGTIEEVNDYINKILLKLTGINLKVRKNINTDEEDVNEEKNSIYYEQELFIETFKIIHLVMANDNSDAGKYFNNFAIEHLRNHYNQFTDLSKVSIIDLLIENFIELSESILNESLDKTQFNISQMDKKIIIKYNGEISYKKHLDYILQTFNLYNNVIIPEYRYYIYNNEFIIELEVAGKTKNVVCDNTFKNGYYYFNFSGEKIDDLKSDLEFKNYYTSTKINIFHLCLPISIKKVKLKSDNYNYKDCGNGILSFKFELYQKSNIIQTYD